jgi:type IV pilus assembly protein PilB
MPSLKERVITTLVSRGLVTRKQLEEALAQQRPGDRGLHRVLVDQGLVSESDLLGALSEGLGIPLISLSRLKLDPALKALIPRELAAQYELVPVSCMGQTLTVAMADPLNIFALDTITTATGLSINPMLGTPTEIREAIDLYYGTGVEETLRTIVKKSEAAELELVREEQGEWDPSRLLKQTQEAPVVKFTDGLLTQAVRLRASDLLIEPRESSVRVRFRVDGVFREGPAPPKGLHEAVVSRIKVMSELNIAERRLPQDGHFSFQVDERAVDFRVSVLPSTFGGNVCLRVLDKGKVKLSIDALGFAPEDLAKLKECAKQPHGMLLTTGPTGSGKTTTLYSLLKLIERPELNIVTVEDPVEFALDGINQVNVRPEVGLTFASALRSILRQDPDVIMVGEIRDGETADMAIKSALTGHLVLSTLHTSTAVGSIVRLTNMGIEPFLINSCLMAVIGQRLVRKICRLCLETYRPAEGIAKRLGLIDRQGHIMELARGKGCPTCAQSGYGGREVIAEVCVLTPEVRELILKRAQEREIADVAQRQGMRGLRERALEKAAQHVTTLDEVFRTTVGEVVE